eukprot:TRINITY_DN10428_c0_g1_i1.p1 TRINITY_DN10428_c0_g1~~TRINITY_DN10428_c0_g1_i1.p1  ORF type:complete len:431 (+),score=90.49 TRINITY_DN10428_c0_g1_i1:1228-2520(+)
MRFGILLFATLTAILAELVDFERAGGIPGTAADTALTVCQSNTRILNESLASLEPFDVLLIPNTTFCFTGGIYASDLRDVTIQIDGTIAFENDQKTWPQDSSGHVFECINMERLTNVSFTSSGFGTIFGNGSGWWGAIQYLEKGENRPRLLHIRNSTQLTMSNLLFKDSPYWTVDLQDVADVEIHHCDVDARRDKSDHHDLFDLTAFNTDGFDVSGRDIYIHDVNIWNDDDCIAVKEQTSASLQSSCSENMLFERINASGVGLTIGSIGPSVDHTCVRNITFRDSVMHNTFKGIYMKSRPEEGTGEIRDVLYQNITIYNPTQWAIWIGPQQAGYKDACSLLWPEDPFSSCYVPSNMDWDNIVLKDVTIHSPKTSPGVILGNSTNPMRGLVFDNVVVTNPGSYPWGKDYYKCKGVVNASALHGTQPKPPCF